MEVAKNPNALQRNKQADATYSPIPRLPTNHDFFNECKGGSKIFIEILRKIDAFRMDLDYLEGSYTKRQ